MKTQKSKAKLLTTLSVVLVTIIIALLANWFQFAAEEAVVNSALSELEEISEQYEYVFEGKIEEVLGYLNPMASFIAENDITQDNISDFFSTQANAQQYTALFYIGLDGDGISSTNISRDFSNNEAFLEALHNGEYISQPIIHDETQEIVFNVSVPVKEDGVITAVLYSEVSIDKFFKSYLDETYGKGDIFIVDQDLKFLFSSSEGHTGSVSIPESDISEMGYENVLAAQSNVSNNTNGGFYYNYHGVDKVMAYTPINMTNWALAVNVESALINSELAEAVNQLQFICQTIYWFLIVLICYTTLYHRRSIRKLEKTAHYDTLTGLPNLEKFKQLVADLIKNNPDMDFTMQKMDLAKFHAINEVYGFESGNLVLKKIAETIKENEEETFVCARVGVDEFLMFAGNGFLDKDENARDYAEQLFKEKVTVLSDHEFIFRYGRYFIAKGENDIIDIINKTSLAHSKAKKNPQRKTWDYNNNFRQDALRSTEISNKKNAAIQNEEFKVFLQPKFGIHDDVLIGAEALVRWVEADGTMIYPNDFIPLFEKSGFIVELDRYVLEHTCMALRKWIDSGLGAICISVNLSRVNLTNPRIVEDIADIVDKYDLPHELIEIELTESASLEHNDALEMLYAKLHATGFKTSIDDFGSGYSSLAMLKTLNVHTLKMDRSFFVDGKSQRRDGMLIDGIVKLSHSLGMYVVAEGIETADQIELLKTMNCDAVQGYFYAKPMPIEMFEEKYQQHMPGNQSDTKDKVALIQSINDAKFANSFVPCGIIVSELDKYFTILEANAGYFDIMGYSREEIRDEFKNRGIALIHPDDQADVLKYFYEKIESGPDIQLDYVLRLKTKKNGYITAQISGKVTANEKGVHRLYFSLSDITSYSEISNTLSKERDFNSKIAFLTNSVFFDFDTSSKTMRFSKSFADKFNIPDTIENFTESEIAKTLFPDRYTAVNNSPRYTNSVMDGEFYMRLPNGEPVWYIYSCREIYDEAERKYRVVGKMSEAIAHKLEMDILKLKSDTNPLINVYDKSATERYIHNYLRTSSADTQTGAFFVVNLEHFSKITEVFGDEYGYTCLKDIGNIFRNMFRSSDIIGRMHGDEFYVFITNYKAVEFVQKKAEALCKNLNIEYGQDGNTLEIIPNIGISLYPEHGDDFQILYKKSLVALEQAKLDGKSKFCIYEEIEAPVE